MTQRIQRMEKMGAGSAVATIFDTHFHRRAQIKMRVLLALDRAGLSVSGVEQRRHLQTAELHHGATWPEVRVEVLGEELCSECDTLAARGGESFYLGNLERLFGFGSPLGHEVCRLLGGDRKQARQAGIASGLLNAFTSLFDKVYDDYPAMAPRLGELVHREVLESALGLEDGKSIETIPDDPVVLRVLGRLMDAYFRLCRTAAARRSDPKGLAQLRSLIVDMHHVEVRSVDMLLDSDLDRDEVLSVLRGKSVGPAVALLRTAQLFLPETADPPLLRWHDVMTSFGTVAWILDDLVDSAGDVMARRWNYVLLEHAGSPLPTLGRDGDRQRTDAEILDEVLASDAVDQAAREMCAQLAHSLKVLGEIAPDSDDIRRQLLVSINRWITTAH